MTNKILTAKSGYLTEQTEYRPGLSVKNILDMTDLRVRSGCRGIGACGLCKIKIESKNVMEPEKIEKLQLSEEELADNIRLACMVKPTENMTITVISPAVKSMWKTVYEKERHILYPLSSYQWPVTRVPSPSPLGAAVDLGTTNISVALFDLKNGKQLVTRLGPNPQARFGSDIITRLTAACQSPDHLKSMQKEVTEAIGDGLADIAIREGIAIEQIVSLSLVGNTAMLAILSGQNYAMLLEPKYWMQYVDCLPRETSELVAALRLCPDTNIRVNPPLAGFVGSDFVAGIVTTGLFIKEYPALFIDFGTNSEIGLWDGNHFFVTSAAGGPAFEGSGISNGMPAEPGAIYSAKPGNSEKWEIKTVTNREPEGICGSGLVDIISILLQNKILSQAGKLDPKVQSGGKGDKFVLPIDSEKNISVTNKDIDRFQAAKAAIGTGVIVMCRESGIDIHKLKRVCVGGAFGQYLDIENAQTVGLLPLTASKKIEIYGNTAITGCADILLSEDAFKQAKMINQKSEIINLSACEDFEDLFLKNLWLRPMSDTCYE
ncbi:MAG: DUF4445 domain-containing protein [Desulfobacteraceae bacterium]|nr:DUF4445 domain-containing protein [Desulfobacteraceae bacterium]